MKTKNNFRSSLLSTFVLSVLIAFTSCSSDSDYVANDTSSYLSQTTPSKEKTEPVDEYTFAVNLRVQKEGKDITRDSKIESAKLFVFDSQNEYVKTISITRNDIINGRSAEFTCPGHDKVTVLAWGGLNEEMVKISEAKVISDFKLSVKYNNGLAETPSDLLYGQITLSRNQTKSEDAPTTVFVERKVSSMQIYVQDVVEKFGSSEGDFYFIVRQTGNSFDYQGAMSGDVTDYLIPARLNPVGNLITDLVPVLAGDDVVVELYKDDVLVFSTQNAKNGKFIVTEPGMQSFVNVSLTKNKYTATNGSWGAKMVVATIK